MFRVTKTYGHNLGLSAMFRQPHATSHCRDPHGYALSFKLTFAAPELNANNWVIDFGSLKPVKAWLAETFDHRTILAQDDPALHDFQNLYQKWGFKAPLVIPFVGCEGFAQYTADNIIRVLKESDLQGGDQNGVFLESVEVREHEGNSASWHAPSKQIGTQELLLTLDTSSVTMELKPIIDRLITEERLRHGRPSSQNRIL